MTESGIIKAQLAPKLARTALISNLSKNTTAVFIATHCDCQTESYRAENPLEIHLYFDRWLKARTHRLMVEASTAEIRQRVSGKHNIPEVLRWQWHRSYELLWFMPSYYLA
jgi:hypothetical protein